MGGIDKACARAGDAARPWALTAPLRDLEGYWLELHCCRGATLLPVRLILERQGDRHRLGDVLDKLACKMCGNPPARAYLNETPNRIGQGGAPPGWSVQLIPAQDGEAPA